MLLATRVLLWIVRISGLLQIALGLLFWLGYARQFLQVHIVNGFLIVAGLWVLAIVALVVRARLPLVVFALAWGLALPGLGLPQAGILPGKWHWIIRLIHLAMGVVALALADRLAQAILRRNA